MIDFFWVFVFVFFFFSYAKTEFCEELYLGIVPSQSPVDEFEMPAHLTLQRADDNSVLSPGNSDISKA